MTNKLVFRNAMIALLVLCLGLSCRAQKTSKRVDAITYVLSDTLNPEFYLIPLTFKFKGSDSTWIGYKSVLELYKFCNKKHGWSRDEFVNQMRPILLHDKTFEIDESFFSMKQSIPKSECSCLFNEDSDKLKKRILNNNYYKYPDNRFACFVDKCFKNNLLLGWMESKLMFEER